MAVVRAVWIDPQALAWLVQSPVPPEATYRVAADWAHAGGAPITVAVTAPPNNSDPGQQDSRQHVPTLRLVLTHRCSHRLIPIRRAPVPPHPHRTARLFRCVGWSLEY